MGSTIAPAPGSSPGIGGIGATPIRCSSVAALRSLAGRIARAAFLIALCLTVASCTNDDIVLDLGTLPGEVVKLRVQATLDGRPLQELPISQRLRRMVLHLPAGVQGQLSVIVTGLGLNDCKIATGTASVDYQRGGAGPTIVAAPLVPTPTPLCAVSLSRSGVAGRVVSTPPGMDCSQDLCVAEFPPGTTVSLKAVPAAAGAAAEYVRGVWSGACTGALDCSFLVNGPVAVSAALDWSYCSTPQCWTNIPVKADDAISGMWGSSPTDVWAVGSYTQYHYNGTRWVAQPHIPETYTLRGISGSSASDVWIVGEKKILHFDGSSWTANPDPYTYAPLSAVWSSSIEESWAVGARGLILHYTPATGWTKRAKDQVIIGDLYSVWGSSSSDVWAVGSQILHYDGVSWRVHPDSLTFLGRALDGLSGTGADNVWAIALSIDISGYRTSVVHFNGSRWAVDASSALLCPEPRSVVGTSAHSIFVSSGSQICYFDGTRWSQDGFSAEKKYDSVNLWSSSAIGTWAVGEDFYRFAAH